MALEISLSQPVDVVYRVMTDRDFLLRRCQANAEREVKVDVSDSGSERQVVLRRDVERNLPGFARKLFRATNRIVDRQKWRSEGGRKLCSYEVEVVGEKLVSIRGEMAIEPDGPEGRASKLRETFSISVSVPLIGRKLEAFAASQMEASLRTNLEFLRTTVQSM